jgi:hypothetical protein
MKTDFHLGVNFIYMQISIGQRCPINLVMVQVPPPYFYFAISGLRLQVHITVLVCSEAETMQ